MKLNNVYLGEKLSRHIIDIGKTLGLGGLSF